MRVAIEAASLALTSGGLARYTGELSLALARCFPDDEFFLVSDQPFAMPPCAPANLMRGGGPRSAAERRWWIWGLHREMGRLGADLIHGPDFSVPVHSPVSQRDDAPTTSRPGWTPVGTTPPAASGAAPPVLLDLGIATMIVTPSEAVRKQAIEHFRLRPERVVAVPEAPAPWLQPVAAAVFTPPYFLFVGTLEPRKNLPPAAGGLARSTQETYCGPGAGRTPPSGRPRNSPAAGAAVDRRSPGRGAGPHFIPAHWHWSTRLCMKASGCPCWRPCSAGAAVIASHAVAEAAGEAAVYADDGPALVRAMIDAATRPEWVAEHRALSLARACEFSWDRTARLTRQVYEEARRRFAR